MKSDSWHVSGPGIHNQSVPRKTLTQVKRYVTKMRKRGLWPAMPITIRIHHGGGLYENVCKF